MGSCINEHKIKWKGLFRNSPDLKKAYDSVPISQLINKLIKRKTPSGINMLNKCSWAETDGMEFNINKSTYLLKSNNNPNISNKYSGFGYGSGYKFRSTSSSFFGSSSSSGSGSSGPSTSHYGSSSSSSSGVGYVYSFFKKYYSYSISSNNKLNLYLKINNKKEYLKGQYSYDYLGFPHTTQGIQWQSHLELSAKKALSILESIHYRNVVIPHYIRLIIFRMFIRPMMEHGACLAFYLMDENETRKFEKKYLLDDFKEVNAYHQVIKNGLEWIVNNKRISNPACLLGIPKTMTKLYCLELKFKKHLTKMDKENPLYIAFNPPPNIKKFNSPSLAYRCYCSEDLFTKYKYLVQQMSLPLLNYLIEKNKRDNFL
ncbi:hypothetical protein PIROE2DRAFT_59379 [Piromyces sp. E2]|nr:hypothetical protein PIROE2DRAFT_59379 [Piromyces sp. E2]|eukprot:OUM66400.1 hypothetical protein PIROE2DRAFT_59379 [Piromyces sp. E2]